MKNLNALKKLGLLSEINKNEEVTKSQLSIQLSEKSENKIDLFNPFTNLVSQLKPEPIDDRNYKGDILVESKFFNRTNFFGNQSNFGNPQTLIIPKTENELGFVQESIICGTKNNEELSFKFRDQDNICQNNERDDLQQWQLKKAKFKISTENQKIVEVPNFHTPLKVNRLPKNEERGEKNMMSYLKKLNMNKKIVVHNVAENEAWKLGLKFLGIKVDFFTQCISNNLWTDLPEPLKTHNLGNFNARKFEKLLVIVKNFELAKDTITLHLKDFAQEASASVLRSIFKDEIDNSIYQSQVMDSKNENGVREDEKTVLFKTCEKLVLKIGMCLLLTDVTSFTPSENKSYLLISEKNIYAAFYE